ncbi:MAG: FAD-dependent oxidoreductase, partial [Planctomycetota bacterium]|nr:FAD-dependent oxidoreductase [Planctomycetota bacterium]
MESKNACWQGMAQGAAAEIEASLALQEVGVEVLYYAAPLAVEMSGKMLAAVLVGVKGSGVRRLVSRQWLDATEDGESIRLLRPHAASPLPQRQSAFAFFRHASWPKTADENLISPLPEDISALRWRAAPWPGERYLEMEIAAGVPLFRAIPAALRELRARQPDACQAALVSHCSVVPLPFYAPAKRQKIFLPPNMAAACAWLSPTPLTTLAERFENGATAARVLLQAERCDAGKRLRNRDIDPAAIAAAEAEAEVAVAGLGTGGALGAIA